MNRISPNIALATVLLAALVVTGCKKQDEVPVPPTAEAPAPAAEPAPAPAPAVVPLAVQDIEIGSAVGPDNRITTPSTTLGTRDTVYASVRTSGIANGNKLGVRWSFQDGTTEGKTVSTDERAITGENTVTEFHAATSTGWPTGKYKVEVVLDGTPAQTREFEIR